MKNINTCECCGAKIVEYKHVLNKGLVNALYQLSLYKNPVNLQSLDITRNQWTNFQKLRYWGLVAKELHADGTGTGNWYVTSKGRDFISNNLAVNRDAWTFRGETVRFGVETISFDETFDENYRVKIDYAREAAVHV